MCVIALPPPLRVPVLQLTGPSLPLLQEGRLPGRPGAQVAPGSWQAEGSLCITAGWSGSPADVPTEGPRAGAGRFLSVAGAEGWAVEDGRLSWESADGGHRPHLPRRVRGPASPAGWFSFWGRGGCASESKDSGFRRPGPVCRQCRRLSSLCLSASLLALGDAVHLLWVVLGRVSTPRDVAKGSRVLPAEGCLPCLLRKPWPPPAMRQEAGRAGGR